MDHSIDLERFKVLKWVGIASLIVTAPMLMIPFMAFEAPSEHSRILPYVVLIVVLAFCASPFVCPALARRELLKGHRVFAYVLALLPSSPLLLLTLSNLFLYAYTVVKIAA